MEIIEHTNNICQLNFNAKSQRIAILSDLHWDNPKCDRELLKKHLNYCLKENIPVHINGDMFCLMQGRGDRRSNKSDILPEHNNAHYLDSVAETAVDFFKPYADIIFCIGYGNHETAIIKHQETDVLRNFVYRFKKETGSNVHLGGYGGWCVYQLKFGGSKTSFKHKYFHGSGGGGIVTKGAINITRAMEVYEGYDLFSMGHIHENWSRTDLREYLHTNQTARVVHKHIHSALTGTYKEEYKDGSKGWHIERGAPPKFIGGRIATFSFRRYREDGVMITEKKVSSDQFPLM